MIKLISNIPQINNDIADIIRLFYSFEKIVYEKGEYAKIEFVHSHKEDEGMWKEQIEFSEGVLHKSFEYAYAPPDITTEIKYKRHLKRSSTLAFYKLLKEITGKNLLWGALTGIRPTHLFRMMDEESNGNAEQMLADDYDVSPDKIHLIKRIIEAQKAVYKKDCENSVDLYIGIPFCPTRCEYCSFISFDM